MKFNERLTQLRKKEGLSQEELGYKLNVTRQTVSKWELGQTKPEMDKLTEISQLFNISVDELINESEATTNTADVNPIIEDKPIGDEGSKGRNKAIIIVVIIVATVLILGVLLFGSFVNNIFNKAEGISQNIIGGSLSFFDKIGGISDDQMNLMDNNQNYFDKILDEYEEQVNEMKEEDNKTGEEFKNKVEEMQNRFESIDSEYDEKFSDFEIAQFNNSFEIFAGTKMGGHVTHVLDSIITSNKTKDRKITVEYNGTETKDETKIKEIKRKIDTFSNYEITFEYDKDKFINKAIIEKI